MSWLKPPKLSSTCQQTPQPLNHPESPSVDSCGWSRYCPTTTPMKRSCSHSKSASTGQSEATGRLFARLLLSHSKWIQLWQLPQCQHICTRQAICNMMLYTKLVLPVLPTVKAQSVGLFVQGWMSPEPLLCVVVVPVLLAGVFCTVAGNQSSIIYARRAVRQLILLTAGVYLMSPLLQTLTSSVSR